MAEPSADDPGRRGTLVVKDRVVERLATFAALSVPGVARHATGLDRVTGRNLPRVQVTVTGGHVRTAIDIAVVWPQPLAQVTASVRAHVTAQLTELAGLQVDAVDVSVPTVVPTSSTASGRRVQ